MTGQDAPGDARDPRIELVPYTDPNEGAFHVSLPRGWKNQAFTVRPHGAPRSVITSERPDGNLFLYWGDPQMPAFQEPGPMTWMNPMAAMNPMLRVYPFTPAEPFFVDYVRQRFGGAPGFRITKNDGPSARIERETMESAQRYGMAHQTRVTSVGLSFEYRDPRRNGVRVAGRLHGSTFTTGSIWVADLFGAYATGEDGDPARFDALLFLIGSTRKSEPRWQAMQNQAHVNRMAEIQQDHQRAMSQMQATHQSTMQNIQQSAQAHQARMADLHASNDAQLQGWYQQQAAGDAAHGQFMDSLRNVNAAGTSASPGGDDFGHRRFLNTVTDQETVIGADGASYQVDAGSERYYRDTRENTYVGTDSTVERDDLRSKLDVIPYDFEELKIRR